MSTDSLASNHFDYNSKEEKLKEMVDIVRDRILDHKTFPLTPRTDAAFISKFIRSKKYNVDAAVVAIHKYYDSVYALLRQHEGIKAGDYVKVYNLDAVRLLKHKINGATVLFASVGRWDTKVASLKEMENAGSFIVEELFQDPQLQINGAIGVADVSGFGFCHARQINYHEMKFLIKVALEMFPIRIAGLHFVNVPTIFWPIYKVAMKLLPKKLQGRVRIHNTVQDLAKALGPSIVPQSFGGELEEEDAWDRTHLPELLERNPTYESYWNGAAMPHRPRRLSRKRSSMMMTS